MGGKEGTPSDESNDSNSSEGSTDRKSSDRSTKTKSSEGSTNNSNSKAAESRDKDFFKSMSEAKDPSYSSELVGSININGAEIPVILPNFFKDEE